VNCTGTGRVFFVRENQPVDGLNEFLILQRHFGVS